MKLEPARAPLGPLERLIALLVPWAFVAVFCSLYVWVLLPRVREGHLIGLIFGVFMTFVVVVCVLAAVTFSRDVLRGRWP